MDWMNHEHSHAVETIFLLLNGWADMNINVERKKNPRNLFNCPGIFRLKS